MNVTTPIMITPIVRTALTTTGTITVIVAIASTPVIVGAGFVGVATGESEHDVGAAGDVLVRRMVALVLRARLARLGSWALGC